MNPANCFSAFTILAALTLSLPARADIPPDDVCSSSALGQPCNNATSDGSSFQPGVCKSAMCSRSTPDGPMTYACFRCEVAEKGAGGQPNEGGAGAGGRGASDVGGSSAAGAPTRSPGGTSAGGTPSSSAGAGTAGAKAGSGGGASATKTPDDGGGCSVAQARGSAGLAAALAALGLMVAGLRRRRSLTS